jgi:pyruvate ferredoxin oxidoreductase gamma subunit
MFELCLIGRGGQGVVTSATIIADAALYEDHYPQKMPVYSAARRGAIVRVFVRIDDSPILQRGPVYTPDCVIVFDQGLPVETSAQGLLSSGVLIINRKHQDDTGTETNIAKEARVDANAISKEVYGFRPIPLTNCIMIGAFCKAVDMIDISSVTAVLKNYFHSRLLEDNTRALRYGYERTTVIERSNPEPEYLAAPMDPIPAAVLPAKDLSPGPVFKPNDISDIKTGSWRNRKPDIDHVICTGCKTCLPLCPEGTIAESDDGIFIDYDYCKGCGLCIEVCPVDSITMHEEDLDE